TTHREKIHNEAPDLKDNQYYMCIGLKSELRECPENTRYSELHRACIPMSECTDKEDGYTIPIDENSFIRCHHENEFVIKCPHGVFDYHGEHLLECVNINCLEPESIQYFENKYF